MCDSKEYMELRVADRADEPAATAIPVTWRRPEWVVETQTATDGAVLYYGPWTRLHPGQLNEHAIAVRLTGADEMTAYPDGSIKAEREDPFVQLRLGVRNHEYVNLYLKDAVALAEILDGLFTVAKVDRERQQAA